MKLIYNNKIIQNNEILTPNYTQKEPEIRIDTNKNDLYSLVMYDPDAVNGTYIHWILVNIKNNNIKTGTIILPYKGPSPPPNTGKHRYIFEIFEQKEYLDKKQIERNNSINSIKSILNLDKSLNKIQFISENKVGGRKTKRKRNISKKSKRRY